LAILAQASVALHLGMGGLVPKLQCPRKPSDMESKVAATANRSNMMPATPQEVVTPATDHQSFSCPLDEDTIAEGNESSWHCKYAPPPQFEGKAIHSQPRFEPGDPSARKFLNDNGYAVFANVLDHSEVQTARILFWEWAEANSQGKVRRHSPQTWSDSTWPADQGNGLMAADGLGQSKFMWFVRARPRLLLAYASLWELDDPEDLVVSFDGAGAFRPTFVNSSWRTRGNWYHVDQNGNSSGSDLRCVQGLVTLLDSNNNTGGFTVLPGSHKSHADIFRRWPVQRNNDFFLLPRSDALLTGPKSIPARLVQARAGDLVVWDSRSIHCNNPAPHAFDTTRLDEALIGADLKMCVEGMCRESTSVAEAVWQFNNACQCGPRRLASLLNIWDVPSDHHAKLLEQLTTWRNELSQALHSADKSNIKDIAAAGGLQRLVAYVCALPRSRADASVLKKRQLAVVLGGTTTHWPTKVELTRKAPGAPCTVKAADLSKTCLRLIGCVGPDEEAMRLEFDEAVQRVQMIQKVETDEEEECSTDDSSRPAKDDEQVSPQDTFTCHQEGATASDKADESELKKCRHARD